MKNFLLNSESIITLKYDYSCPGTALKTVHLILVEAGGTTIAVTQDSTDNGEET